jgi:hypothetical protein
VLFVSCCSNDKTGSGIERHCSQQEKTYGEAKAFCSSQGNRLCTADEVLDGATVGKGCSLDGPNIGSALDMNMAWTSDACQAIQSTGDWMLVRRVKAGLSWHPATDQLAGTAEYGTVASSTADETFSIPFSHIEFDEFKFETGDGQKWLIATKEAVIGEHYANSLRRIESSSMSASPYSAKWYNRKAAVEDPWISLQDHADAIPAGDILYGENSFGGAHAANVLNTHNGANVWIRQKA